MKTTCYSLIYIELYLKDGELTLAGFLTLHEMEAEDTDGDEAELWTTLHSLG